MDKYLSKKIAFFHVIGVFIVLYIHAFLPDIEDSAFNNIQSFWGQVFCRVFHPMYFSLAGYLFFFSIKEGNIAEFSKKLKSRFHSLVIPYLVCNIIGGLFIIWISRYGFASLNIQESMEYYNSHTPLLFFFYRPALGQLWFVRDLILIVCFTYPLYLLLKKGRLWALGGLLLLVVLMKGHIHNTSLLLSLFSFSVGAYLSIFKVNVRHIPHKMIVYALAVAYLIVFYHINGKVEYYVQSLCAWSLFLACWLLYDTCSDLLNNITKWGGYSFFVYIFHDPLMSLTKFALYDFYSDTLFMQVITYCLVPLTFYFVLSAIAYLMNKYCSSLYKCLVGGR